MPPIPRRLACIAALLAAAGSAVAQDAQALRTRSLAATCAQCHGTDGRNGEGAALPALAGLPAARIAEQLTAFKSGARGGSVMPQLAKGYSDAQIAQLASYFANVAAATR